MAYRPARNRRESSGISLERRLWVLAFAFAIAGAGFAARLFQLQVIEHRTFKVLASDQHEIQAALIPRRGTVYVRERLGGELHPIAKDRDVWQVYAVMREMKDPKAVAHEAAELLSLPESELLSRFTSPTTTYLVLIKDVPLETVEQVNARRIPGIGVAKAQARYYPEAGIGGHVIGFVSLDDQNRRVGRYGVEGFENKELAGDPGSIVAEKDAAGRRLAIGAVHLKEARDGSDIVLTIDRTIQYEACQRIRAAVGEFQAERGTVIVMDPDTGAIRAMCSFPDFEPSSYNTVKEISTLNNPAVFYQFEPGSIFKPITMAAGLDANKVQPNTTYTDRGEETMDDFTVRNSDKLAHGVQTMTEVLEKSLNTGTIFVQRLLGRDLFKNYVEKFGFGEKTGVELQTEVKGNIAPLSKKGKIFAATASYGQGITTTPIQMVAAYGALANGGHLLKPYVVDEVIRPDGTREKVKPAEVREVISRRTSRLISGMLVSVVEHGHGKRAGVPGYYVAGKTGTAQIPDPNGQGYLKDASIGSFIGYAPADHPKFVMIVKIDKPKDLAYAESSAAPVFGSLAKFLLAYYQVPPERPIVETPLPKLPTAATGTSSSSTGTR